MRPRSLVLLLVGVVVLLGGCAGADRVVTSRETTVASNGMPVYRLEWTSGAYGPRVFDYPRPDRDFEQDCYRHVVVGEAVPFACMTIGVLHDETDAFDRNRMLAVVLSLVVTAALALFSLRRISWAPLVSPMTDHLGSSETAGSPASAIELMRSVESEKDSQVQASAEGHDISHPGWTGAATGLVILGVLTVLVGLGTSLSWGIVTAILMFFGVGGTGVFLVLGGLTRRSNLDPLIRRLSFLGGAIIVMLVVSLIGLGLRWPLYRLNGMDWPG